MSFPMVTVKTPDMYDGLLIISEELYPESVTVFPSNSCDTLLGLDVVDMVDGPIVSSSIPSLYQRIMRCCGKLENDTFKWRIPGPFNLKPVQAITGMADEQVKAIIALEGEGSCKLHTCNSLQNVYK